MVQFCGNCGGIELHSNHNTVVPRSYRWSRYRDNNTLQKTGTWRCGNLV